VALNLDSVLETLPDDRIEAAHKLLTNIVGRAAQGASREDLYEALGMFEAFAKANGLDAPEHNPTGWSQSDLGSYFRFDPAALSGAD
jgi:hypothetical protein